LATALSILTLSSLVLYLTLVRPIAIESRKIEKELLLKRLQEEQECLRMQESMETEHGFKLKCIEIMKAFTP